jgi:hypothetical protein
MTSSPARMVPVVRLIDDLARQELKLKLAGAFAEANGIRDAIVRILRLANEGETSMDNTGED